MNNKISKKVTAGVLSVLVFGSQFPSGSAHENTCNCNAEYYSNLRVNENGSHVKTKGVFDVPGLEGALERAMGYHSCCPGPVCNCINGINDVNSFCIDRMPKASNCVENRFVDSYLISDEGHVVVKVGGRSFELAYDKLVNKETGEIDEIEVPSCICSISSGVFKDILKNANAQGKKIKKVILPEYLRRAAEDIFADVSVDSVVFESNSSDELNTNVFKGALNIGAVFVPKRFEEKVKADLKGKNIRVFEDFELKNAFDIEGLKDAIMDALANKKDICFKRDYNGSFSVLCVGDKEFHPDYSRLKDEKTGKIEDLELPYGINYIDSPVIHNIYASIYKGDGKSIFTMEKVNRIVIPNTVEHIGKGLFLFVRANHVILSKNLRSLSPDAFGWSIRRIGVGSSPVFPNCDIKEITVPAKFESMLKEIFGNGKEFNFI